MTTGTSEMGALKARLHTVWNTGDYDHLAQSLENAATDYLKTLTIEPGSRVLDVACGTGQAALLLARRGALVTGVDIATASLEKARERAQAEGLEILFDEGDAEGLVHANACFDLVITLIGAMFAPRPERVAAEMVRVCRPGGRVVMINWTPEGFIGQMLKIVGKHVPPPPMPSPLLWGDEKVVAERLSSGIAALQLERRNYPFFYPFGPAEVVDLYLREYGPTVRAYAALDDTGKAALRSDLVDLWTDANTATDGTTHADAEVLEVVAIRA